ncbi:MAG TPA: hypothetical protein VGC16_08955, partial [Rhizomicrobium sp.]
MTSALFAALPARAQDQNQDQAQPAKPAAEAKPDAKPSDKAKPVKVAQNQTPETQATDSPPDRVIPGRLRNYEKPPQQNNAGAVQAPPPEAFP